MMKIIYSPPLIRSIVGLMFYYVFFYVKITFITDNASASG